MQPVLLIDVPMLPPTTNHLYEGMGKRRHRTDAYESWLRLLIPTARLAAGEIGWTHREGIIYQLTLWLQFPSRRRTDASNRIKAAEDALSYALDFDDEHIVYPRALHCGYVKNEPRTLILLEVISARPVWGVVNGVDVLKTRRPYMPS